ncbi:MAG: hypothetical protein P8P74_15805 [Crocinitomicaceae bacterium]|nr:hypothetical protein [Crocinitomicaceae bacterium]
MKIFNRLLLVAFVSIAGLLSCNKDTTYAECTLEHCTPGAVSYEDDIKPLIQQSCATGLGPQTGCHDAWIFNYDNVKKSIDDGVFGNEIATESMPMMPNSFGIVPLTDAEKEMFECWICDGALEN